MSPFFAIAAPSLVISMSDNGLLLLFIFFCMTAAGWLLVLFSARLLLIYRNAFTSNAENNLERMFLFFDYRKMFITNIAILLLVPLVTYVLTKNPFFCVVMFIVLLFAPRQVLKLLDKKRKIKIVASLPDALAQLAGSMKSGATFTSSIEIMVAEMKGPISQEFGLMLKEHKLGITLKDALENLGERINMEEMDLVVTAALIARDVGGNLSETFERLSIMLRRKIEMEGKIKALTSQGKMQGWVVSALPFGVIFGLVWLDPDSIKPIFSTYLGWGFMVAILLLELMGGVMIKKIVSIDV